MRPLGPAEPPASRYGDAARVLGHRDYPLVADTAGRAQARDLAAMVTSARQHLNQIEAALMARPMQGEE